MGARGPSICGIKTRGRRQRTSGDRLFRRDSTARPSPYEGAALPAAPRSRDVSVRESGDVEMWAGPGTHTSSPMRGERSEERRVGKGWRARWAGEEWIERSGEEEQD